MRLPSLSVLPPACSLPFIATYQEPWGVWVDPSLNSPISRAWRARFFTEQHYSLQCSAMIEWPLIPLDIFSTCPPLLRSNAMTWLAFNDSDEGSHSWG
eukprot:835457-Pelagomonas_calceolata.AAC.3